MRQNFKGSELVFVSILLVNHNSVFLQEKVDVCVELFFSAFSQEDQKRSAGLKVFLQMVDLSLGELLP